MSGNETRSGPGAGPRRGRPPRLSRDQIIAAALEVAPAPVTMQAVAEALGVDRKSLNYHVGDREALLALMAATVFESEVARVPPPTDGDWRDVLRWYGYTVRGVVTQLGVHDSIPVEGVIGFAALVQAEFVLATLVDAGFEVNQAGRAANVVVELAVSAARDSLLRAGQGAHPQREAAAGAVGDAQGRDFPVLREILAAMSAEDNEDAQLEFNLDIVFVGLAALLDTASEG